MSENISLVWEQTGRSLCEDEYMHTEMSNVEHSTQDVSIPALFALNPQEHSTTLQSWKSTGSIHPVIPVQADISALGNATSRHFKLWDFEESWCPPWWVQGWRSDRGDQSPHYCWKSQIPHPFPVSNLGVSGTPSPPWALSNHSGVQGANKHMEKCSFWYQHYFT